MNKIQTVGMDTMAELASAIVERRYNQDNAYNLSAPSHSYQDKNGDWLYIEEVQDEFLAVLDIIDDILNPER